MQSGKAIAEFLKITEKSTYHFFDFNFLIELADIVEASSISLLASSKISFASRLFFSASFSAVFASSLILFCASFFDFSFTSRT